MPRRIVSGLGSVYFVTICTYQRHSLFGNAVYHRVVEHGWRSIPRHFSSARADAFVVMPNHVHGIIHIVGARHSADNEAMEETPDLMMKSEPNVPPQKNASSLPRLMPGSLGAIVGNFKSVTARRINRIRQTPGEPVWLRNYYERVVRNDAELTRIREYIQLNPLKWEYDHENPSRRSDDTYQKQWGWLEKPR